MQRKWTDEQVLAVMRAPNAAARRAVAAEMGMSFKVAVEFCGSSKRRALLLREQHGIQRRKRWASPITTSLLDQRRMIEDALRRD